MKCLRVGTMAVPTEGERQQPPCRREAHHGEHCAYITLQPTGNTDLESFPS